MSNWIDVAAEADLFEGAGIAVTPLNHDIAVFKVDEGVFAINNECSKQTDFMQALLHQDHWQTVDHAQRADGKLNCPLSSIVSGSRLPASIS